MQIMVPGLVPVPLMPRAVAASATANQAATIAGPALGGFLYAAGPMVVYGVCLALFAAAVTLTLLIRMERSAPRREPMSLAVLFAGFSFIRRNPIVFGVISLDLFVVLLGGVTALLPVFARDVFAAGPWALGLLRAAPRHRDSRRSPARRPRRPARRSSSSRSRGAGSRAAPDWATRPARPAWRRRARLRAERRR